MGGTFKIKYPMLLVVFCKDLTVFSPLCICWGCVPDNCWPVGNLWLKKPVGEVCACWTFKPLV